MNKKKIYTGLIILIILQIPYWEVDLQKENQLPNVQSEPKGGRNLWEWGPSTLVTPELFDYSALQSVDIDCYGNLHLVWLDTTDILGAGPEYDVFYRMWNVTTSSLTDIELLTPESTGFFISGVKIKVDLWGNKHFMWTEHAEYADSGIDSDVFYKFYNNSLQTWGAIEVISTGSDLQSFAGSIDLDSQNNLHAVWVDSYNYDILGEGNDQDVYYRSKNFSTGLWGDLEVVSLQSTLGCRNPRITVDQQDDLHVVWEDMTELDGDGAMDIFYSFKNDLYWSVDKMVSEDSTRSAGSPSIACDNQKNVHIVWVDEFDYWSSGTIFDIVHRYYDRKQNAWSDIKVVSTEGNKDSAGPDMICDADGTLHIAWTDLSDFQQSGLSSDIFYKRYYPETDLWTETEVISTQSTESASSPKLATISNTFYVLWNDLTPLLNSGSDSDIYFRTITGPPNTPILSPINPNPSSSKDILLEWSNRLRTNVFYLYRSTEFITSISNLTPIATTSQNYYHDSLLEEDTYYYTVVAGNSELNSSMSNVVYVSVERSHFYFGKRELIFLILVISLLQIGFFLVNTHIIKKEISRLENFNRTHGKG